MFGQPNRDGHRHLVEVDLVREPTNPYDANAVKAVIAGHQVGHLRRETAQLLGPKMDALRVGLITVAGIVLGAFEEGPNYGVRIWGRRIIQVTARLAPSGHGP